MADKKQKQDMILYVVGFAPKTSEIKYYKKSIDTNSLYEINKWIMANPYKDDTHFPLLSSNDKEKLEEEGKTVLLFSNLHYYLVDVNNKENKAILRHINIETILN